jgi:hypothetical protein
MTGSTPAIGTVGLARAQGRALQHADLVEQEDQTRAVAARNARFMQTLPGPDGSG